MIRQQTIANRFHQHQNTDRTLIRELVPILGMCESRVAIHIAHVKHTHTHFRFFALLYTLGQTWPNACTCAMTSCRTSFSLASAYSKSMLSTWLRISATCSSVTFSPGAEETMQQSAKPGVRERSAAAARFSAYSWRTSFAGHVVLVIDTGCSRKSQYLFRLNVYCTWTLKHCFTQ